ncbi:DUF2306 domain-containing protein [Rhodospirillaceae bacterium KN72]|uniref:DUF2306 domain-containing protein n=1 Tax=Pacificispira spongiicola TaxID=2729598 RepID=A0A7Y0HCR9_9PROT|nr:DUF2306 domain-containing protein [Pacificispira spongiicola]NMM42890.1 DUF2306 domain-containing protein [Pacificispira spongiicola]
MTIAPIAGSSIAIQIHVAAAVLAVCLAPLIIARRRRDRMHKAMGYVWVSAMTLTALSSFWVREIRLIGDFSPIHLLSITTLAALIWAIAAIRAGNVRRHQGIMRGLAFWSLGVAGAFTLLPGRRMNAVLFGDFPELGYVAIAILVCGLAVLSIRTRQRSYQ